jgi:hypothetical protein
MGEDGGRGGEDEDYCPRMKNWGAKAVRLTGTEQEE